MPEPVVVVAAQDRLGECPRWHAGSGTLHWLDIPAMKLQRYCPDTGKHSQIALTERVSAFAFCPTGGYVFATGSRLVRADAEGRMHETLASVTLAEDARFNDGAADAAGRFWVGALNAAKRPDNCLYCYDGGALRAADTGIGASNGIGWSPDGSTMYFADSPRKTIFAYDFDVTSGTATNQRTFAATPDEPGVPDGLAVDSAGGVWCAYWDGWRVVRYDADGRETTRIPIPTPRPTACAFGGGGLTTLFVTSASDGVPPGETALAGHLFAVDVGVAGTLPYDANL